MLSGSWTTELGAGAALPADVNQELLLIDWLLNGDVLDQQSQHPLSILGLGGGSLPQPRQILCESQDLGLLLGRGDVGLLTLKFRGLLFEVVQVNQRVVPAPLQCARYQAIGGIDLLVPSLGERHFIL